MKPPIPSGHLVRFGVFELDLRARELREDGASTGLPEQSIKILALLLEKPGEVVLREEIRKKLWPNDTVVEFDHSINAAMKRLRQALGDSPDDPQFIETLARRGYRWKTPVEWVEAQGDLEVHAEVQSKGQPKTASDGNLIGKKISHYRVLQILGGGGMGVIYKAEDLKLSRRVALKFLPEEVASEPSALERFEREARAASALDHPNICAIHEFGEHDSQPFIVMQLLEGETLRERIGATPAHPGKPLPADELLDFAIQITRGLEAAHQKGIIHRDIKPANVFLTNRGEAKILDFGVAKLVHGDGLPEASAHPESADNTRLFGPSSSLNLTRTGTTVGTASYMSPEQILGEKLDARTDLFSFGLVLHEMATGHQAFAGDTAEIIREAILHRPVQPARELNPELPSKVEEVIARALSKDRNVRYQHASEMRADLEDLRQSLAPKARARWREIAAGAAALLLIATAAFWLTRRPTSSPPVPPEPKLRQLTNNSVENAVGGGAISRDGKYIAYTDTRGIRIQLVETGESHGVPQPDGLKADGAAWWEMGDWFVDNTRFVVNSHPPWQYGDNANSQGSSIWVVSVLGGAPRKLRDNATSGTISPDGAFISFTTNKGRFGDREIWLMDPNGEHAQRLYSTGDDSGVGWVVWSPDGQRILYAILNESGGATLVNLDLKGGAPIQLLPTSATTPDTEYLWLPDGRLIYSVFESGAIGQTTSNYWQMRLDARTGKPTETPRRLTNWAGFRITYSSVTADGKRLAFRKMALHLTTYLADLKANGTGIANTRHFSMTESWDVSSDWTADSKAIIMASNWNRTSHFGIYKQLLNEDTAKPLVSGPEDAVGPIVSPDGAWVLYYVPSEKADPKGTISVMRVRITGGPPELIFTARRGSLLLRARSPSNVCAIAEPTEDRKQMVITAFDPVKGRGPELTRIALDPATELPAMDLSPDGTRIAAIRSPEGPIQILSLRGQAAQEITLKGWKNPRQVNWTADGRGLFVTTGAPEAKVLLHVDLRGNAQVLWKVLGSGSIGGPRPSPDGRYLAFVNSTWDSNMWMLEDF